MNLLSLWGQYIGPFLSALITTIELTVLSLLVGAILGVGLAAGRLSAAKSVRLVATTYIDLMRAVPVLVLLLIAYYGLGQVGLKLSGIAAATIALGGFYAALFGEVFRGGVQSVAPGQTEAAEALGMSRWIRLRCVIVPQAFRVILLPSTNLLANIIKDTSLVVTIGVADLMSRSFEASSATFQPMSMLVLAGLIYFALFLAISRVLAGWERRVQRRYS
jgi:polar amino acid transport system permease protein